MKSDVVSALENAGWPALLLDAAGTVLRANAAAAKLLGPAVENSGAHLRAIWSPENSVPAEQFITQWERSPSPVLSLKFSVRGGGVSPQNATLCAHVRDGQRYYLMQLAPENMCGSDPVPVNKPRLECALQLARTVSLDFNNALTSILGHTSLLLSRMGEDHPWRTALLEVEKSAGRAAEIANDLGMFSRQEKRSPPPAEATGNLNQLLQRTVEHFQHPDPSQHVTCSLQLERRLFMAKFDESKLQQAFTKILENSFEAVREAGQVTLQTRNVTVAERTQDRNVQLTPGSYVCAEITDNGCGIEAEVLPRVFEPFFTTKKAAGHRGLGLAWVYGIVTNHGGGVAVSSQTGIGTSVRVYLPAGRGVVPDTALRLDDLRGNETILVVDDEEQMLNVAETILSGYGYRVYTANNGRKALEILLTGNQPAVDLVVTDLVMPHMSGRELTERIRREHPGLPILRTSGCVGHDPRETGPAFLQKPFTSEELLLKVKEVLSSEASSVD